VRILNLYRPVITAITNGPTERRSYIHGVRRQTIGLTFIDLSWNPKNKIFYPNAGNSRVAICNAEVSIVAKCDFDHWISTLVIQKQIEGVWVYGRMKFSGVARIWVEGGGTKRHRNNLIIT